MINTRHMNISCRKSGSSYLFHRHPQATALLCSLTSGARLAALVSMITNYCELAVTEIVR